MSQLGTYNFASIESITGDLGGAVYPIASNVNIIGGPGVTVTGNPVTGTLTITSAAGVSVTSFTTDVAGPVAPTALGVVDINGGNNISTDGTVANRITFNLTGTTNHCVQIGNATNSLTSMAPGINGQTIMGVTGADPAWTSSPQFGGSITALNDITSTAGSINSLSGSIISRDASNAATGPSIYFQKVRVAAVITSGDNLGTLRYTGYDGASYITGAKITSTNSGTVAVNRIAGDLKFWTHPDSVIALPSEPITRMTISPAGNVTIANPDAGTALTIDNGGLTVTAGILQAPTIRTGDPAVLAGIISATTTTISASGTAANVDLTVSTKGTGSINLDVNTGGALLFRGITPGSWTNIDWHMEQHVVQTLDATPTAIFSLVLPAKRVITIKAMVNGFQDDYSDTVGGEILVTAYRDNAGGNIKLVGAPIINVNYTDLIDSSDINAGIDVGTQSIQIYVIGVLAQTWNWASTIQYMYTIDNS